MRPLSEVIDGIEGSLLEFHRGLSRASGTSEAKHALVAEVYNDLEVVQADIGLALSRLSDEPGPATRAKVELEG